MAVNNQKKQSDLDRSIDLGMDQFGRFVKLRWLWLIIAAVVGWYFIVYMAPQLTPPTPGVIFLYAFQIMFAVLYIMIQFVALFWFLGRPRLYWVMPGETGIGFDDYKGNPEVLEAARRIVLLLQGSLVAALELLLAAYFYGRVYGHAVRTGLLARYSAESVA